MSKQPSGSAKGLPRIALVGRTNVGKSSLFNRLVGGTRALVAPTPGLTRDRREGIVRRDGLEFQLVDTGGLEIGSAAVFTAEIAEQVGVAVREADAVWFVLDGSTGVSPLDRDLYRWLLKQGRPTLAVVNKVDNTRRGEEMLEYFALGVAALYPVSAIHGRGLAELLQRTGEVLAGAERPAPPTAQGTAPQGEPIRVALIGKPNVGKSSLVNAILGESRMIVSEIAGTTREPVDVAIERGGTRFTLIDTAGIRKRAKTYDTIEKIGALTSIGSLERCDVAVLVLDAEQGIAEQDAKIAGYIQLHKRAAVVALNKWDRLRHDPEREQGLVLDVQHRLSFLEYAPLVRTSALNNDGIARLFDEIERAYRQFTREVQTADLNRVIELSTRHQPPPMARGSSTRVYYGTQIKSRPPTFRLFTNHPERLEGNYTRFMAHQLRYHFGMQGTPVEIVWRGKSDEDPRLALRGAIKAKSHGGRSAGKPPRPAPAKAKKRSKAAR